MKIRIEFNGASTTDNGESGLGVPKKVLPIDKYDGSLDGGLLHDC